MGASPGPFGSERTQLHPDVAGHSLQDCARPTSRRNSLDSNCSEVGISLRFFSYERVQRNSGHTRKILSCSGSDKPAQIMESYKVSESLVDVIVASIKAHQR